ncbi:DUF1295 domain-containing protein [Sphingomonas sinipercae]|uniref:DUF1295 domain-containing protein n=1 Tax=Sphingomonas sinipercae TaxID=2714944 RepID=A0A6G7ZNW4_9SPHN|nr:isoprenylcysteine carboxylmethyltransferase family protein [Sphingomonas sinipercae]QIL02687.1 DUF1295 domain-containing protein [Sphingomonas sinipercae]
MHTNRILDWGERLFLVALAATFLQAILPRVFEHPYVILLAISECLPVVLILIRKPGTMTRDPLAWLFAFLGTAAPLLVRPAPGGFAMIPEPVVAAMMMSGVAVNILAKVALWRSFGLAPANRGVRSGGLYRLVRHPMYLGYFISQLAFLLANFTVGNIVKYALTWSMQLLRIREEEKFLSADPAYRELQGRVRYRVLPGLY